MKNRRSNLGVSLWLGLVFLAGASSGGSDVRRLNLSSKVLEEERTILVSLPSSYERTDARFPLLVLTDARGHFRHAAATVDFLSSSGHLPEMIVIGVESTDRFRDYTPTKASLPRPDGSVSTFPTSGGADGFASFVVDELLPFVESKFRAESFRVLAGHSLGGLFAAHLAVSGTSEFGAFIASSPALPWDDQQLLTSLRTRIDQQALSTTTLVLSIGSEPRLESSFEAFEAELDRIERSGFRVAVFRFADEDHRSVALRAYYSGLRSIFEGWRIDRDEGSGEIVGGFEALRTHFAGLSERFGYQVKPPSNLIDRLGRQALQTGSFDEAISIFSYAVDIYPRSVSLMINLGLALEKKGDLEAAFDAYETAASFAHDPKSTTRIQHHLTRTKTLLDSN